MLPLPTRQWVAAPPALSRRWGTCHFGARNRSLQEESPTSTPPTLRRDIFFDSLQLCGEDRVHAGDKGDKAPGLAALRAPLTAGTAPALPQRVLLASGSQSATPAPRISSPRSPDTAPVAGPRPEGCPGRSEEPGSPCLPPLFLAILGVSERDATARHLPPRTGPFWRTCSLPQTFFSRHGRDETVMQEGAEREQPV